MMVDVINDLHYKVGEMHNLDKAKVEEIITYQKESNHIVCDTIYEKLKEKGLLAIDL
jgi:hypothetical protein